MEDAPAVAKDKVSVLTKSLYRPDNLAPFAPVHLKRLEDEQTAKQELQHLAEHLNHSREILDFHDPIDALDQFIRICFKHGPRIASYIYDCFCTQLEKGGHELFVKVIPVTNGVIKPMETQTLLDQYWDDHEAVTRFVLMLAAGPDKVISAFNWVKTVCPQGLATLAYFESSPSDDLKAVYDLAKQKAIETKLAWRSVIGVRIIDMAYERLRARDREQGLTSLDHSFVIGIQPEGLRVYQGWRAAKPGGDLMYDECEDEDCKHKLGLEEWMSSGASLLGWTKADKFVDDVTKLAHRKGPMTAKKLDQISKIFVACFGVDPPKVCRKEGRHRPLIDTLDLKIRIHLIGRIQDDDVCKYQWT